MIAAYNDEVRPLLELLEKDKSGNGYHGKIEILAA